jgi:hypothetical protein
MFPSMSPCSYCSSDAIEMICLVNKITVEDEWLEPFVIGPLLTMVVLCLDLFSRTESRMKSRPGGATRGKWRMPDGKGGEWCVFMFRAPKVVAPARVD